MARINAGHIRFLTQRAARSRAGFEHPFWKASEAILAMSINKMKQCKRWQPQSRLSTTPSLIFFERPGELGKRRQ
jgi:hypothetical protein